MSEQNKEATRQTIPVIEEDSLTTFQSKIDAAKFEGEEWVETTPKVIKYFCPKGLGDAGYFMYRDIRVSLPGMKEKILERENEQLDTRLHGKSEGVIEGR